MKVRLSYIIVFVLLAMNFTSIVYAHESVSADGAGQVMQSIDDTSNDTTPSIASQCHRCLCHAGVHMIFPSSDAHNLGMSSSDFIPMNDCPLYSQLPSPPFQPPEA